MRAMCAYHESLRQVEGASFFYLLKFHIIGTSGLGCIDDLQTAIG